MKKPGISDHFPKGTGCTLWFFRMSAGTKLNKAKAISAKLLELIFKNKLEETGNKMKREETGRNRKTERKKNTENRWKLNDTERNRKKQ